MLSVRCEAVRLRTSRWASARAHVGVCALALGACVAVLGLVQLIAFIGLAFRLSVLTQALVFVAITALPLRRQLFLELPTAEGVAIHLLLGVASTYVALWLLARTFSVMTHEVAALTTAAFAEELTFRLALPSFLSKRLSLFAHGAIISVILAQLTFAAAHVVNYATASRTAADLIVLTINGLLLSVIVRYAGLSSAGTSHALFNATGTLDMPHLPSQRSMQWTLIAFAVALLHKTPKSLNQSAHTS